MFVGQKLLKLEFLNFDFAENFLSFFLSFLLSFILFSGISNHFWECACFDCGFRLKVFPKYAKLL